MSHAGQFRSDIQGLRAIAVLSVFIFHLWPSLLPGGFVGVDIFFVISGYLITQGLVNDHLTGKGISLKRFYAKRIRRLLPAATIVLVFAAASIVWLPVVQWSSLANEIVASAFYYQNWWLAFESVDYLAKENSPSILQHFWSLSVEEQFYFVWPILLASALGLARKKDSHFSAILGVSGIILLSLFYSVWMAKVNPPFGYFSTFTRMWELALGALLALLQSYGHLRVLSRNSAYGSWLKLVGLALIVVSLFYIQSDMAFPGYIALIPTTGAFLFICGGVDSKARLLSSILQSRPAVFFGDVSYSLYLWHWPLIVIYHHTISTDISLISGMIIFAIAVLLAYLTKVLIEDPIRFKKSLWSPISSHAYGMASVLLLVSSLSAIYVYERSQEDLGLAESSDDQGLTVPKTITVDTLLPNPSNARKDNPSVYGDGCHVSQAESDVSPCIYGNENSDFHIALVGDSHAAQWVPPLKKLAEAHGWKLTSHTKSACTFNAAPVLIRSERYESCEAWNRNVLADLNRNRPDWVLTTQSTGHKAFGMSDDKDSLRTLAHGLVERWTQLSELGINLLVIRDTPWMKTDVPECLTSQGETLESCSTRRADAIRPDSIELAVQMFDGERYLDLSDVICDSEVCPVNRGTTLVWRDRHHLSATYARSLSGYLYGAIKVASPKNELVSSRVLSNE